MRLGHPRDAFRVCAAAWRGRPTRSPNLCTPLKRSRVVANVAKHAASHDFAVRVHASPREVEVSGGRSREGLFDHGGRGTGRPPPVGDDAPARRRHGTLDVQSTPGKGTRVVAGLAVTDEGVSE